MNFTYDQLERIVCALEGIEIGLKRLTNSEDYGVGVFLQGYGDPLYVPIRVSVEGSVNTDISGNIEVKGEK